jgi:tetrahydromethanopterin S-methyltransferase subunit A
VNKDKDWPPVPGDYHVNDPSHCVAICTLGKRIEIAGEYAIAGSCKTENIGIERVVINVISNPSIRYLILAGPEVPGHLTGRSLRSLYQNGVDPTTRKIIDAAGAIPYIENVPLEGIDRFREQIELVDMINTLDSTRIAEHAKELAKANPGPFPQEAIWLEFKAASREIRRVAASGNISILPEYDLLLESNSSLVSGVEHHATLTEHPSLVVVEVRESDTGTYLVGKEE